jgi:hypothetical protein
LVDGDERKANSDKEPPTKINQCINQHLEQKHPVLGEVVRTQEAAENTNAGLESGHLAILVEVLMFFNPVTSLEWGEPLV